MGSVGAGVDGDGDGDAVEVEVEVEVEEAGAVGDEAAGAGEESPAAAVEDVSVDDLLDGSPGDGVVVGGVGVEPDPLPSMSVIGAASASLAVMGARPKLFSMVRSSEYWL